MKTLFEKTEDEKMKLYWLTKSLKIKGEVRILVGGKDWKKTDKILKQLFSEIKKGNVKVK